MRRLRIALAVLVAAAFTQGTAFAADPGAALFAEHCAMCHGANGEGLPGFGPPLGSAGKRLEAPGGREYLAQVVVYGISGVFELAGQRQFAAMTPQGKLSDDELATVLNHVLRDFNGNAANPLAPADIAAARRAVHTPGELHKTKAALERLEK